MSILFGYDDEPYIGPDPSKTLAGRIIRVVWRRARRTGDVLPQIALKESRYLDFLCHYQTDRLAGPLGWTTVVMQNKGKR